MQKIWLSVDADKAQGQVFFGDRPSGYTWKQLGDDSYALYNSDGNLEVKGDTQKQMLERLTLLMEWRDMLLLYGEVL